MTRKSLFWGCLFISLGILMLLFKLDVIGYDFSDITKFWPVFLILLGLSIMKINDTVRKVLSACSGVFLGLLIAGATIGGKHFVGNVLTFHYSDDDSVGSLIFDGDRAVIPGDSTVNTCDLKLRTVAGKFLLTDSAGGLVDIIGNQTLLHGSRNCDISDGKADIKVSLDYKSYVFKDHPDSESTVIKLNNNAEWNIKAKTNASDFTADLSGLRVNSLEMKSAAAALDLKIGNKSPKTEIYIKSDACGVTIRIPKESGCSVRAKLGLSDITADGFRNIEKNVYETDNYASAGSIVDIEIKGAVSGFEVVRY